MEKPGIDRAVCCTLLEQVEQLHNIVWEYESVCKCVRSSVCMSCYSYMYLICVCVHCMCGGEGEKSIDIISVGNLSLVIMQSSCSIAIFRLGT